MSEKNFASYEDLTLVETKAATKIGDVADDYFLRNGMKNLAKINQESSTMNTVRFTNNGDGSFTVDGTNSKDSGAYCFPMIVPSGYFKKPGKYILSGIPLGTSNISLVLRYNTGSSNVRVAIMDGTAEEVEFTITAAHIAAATLNWNLLLNIAGGATADNVVVRPMIRYASVKDGTYEEYVMTNKELEEALKNISGGHTIVDSEGTELIAESKLQFKGGLSASDDSTNGKTVVSGDYPVFTWDAWIAMTEQEQEAYPDAIITDAPGIDGVLSLDMMTKLWENADPTQSFAAQDIVISNLDKYDKILIQAYDGIGNSYIVSSFGDASIKNILQYVDPGNSASNGTYSMIRFYTPNKTASKITFSDATYGCTGVAEAVSNVYLIPYQIYGIKLQHQIDVSAVITPSSSPNHQFAIATTDWVANTGSDATEFPYVANIATTEFSDTFVPTRVMLLGADGSDYPTAAEEADIALVDKYIEFSDEGVRLRATDTPTNALTLIVAGAVVGTRNMVPVAASDVVLDDGTTSLDSALNYSTTEHKVGKWIDGSDLYEKTVNIGNLDTSTPHGISNISTVVSISGIIQGSTVTDSIPYAGTGGDCVSAHVDSTNISIIKLGNFGTVNAYVTLRYTKTA